MRLRFSSKRREGGAALLTVLLMLTVMSAVAVGLMDEIRFDIRRSVNTRLYEQAFWFAMGGEEFALNAIRAGDEITPGRNTLLSPWAQGPVRLPLDNGMIEASISDGGNCFNLNSVVVDEEETRSSREAGIEQYMNLLEALGINDTERQALASSLADWIDSDGIPGPRGAEDYHYTGLTPPYRTGGVLLADVTELRAIAGYTEAVYRTIRPYLCALPSDILSPINVNTLREDQAPLLTMLVGSDRLAVDRARDLIARRPYDGYANVEDFWADEAFGEFEPDEELAGQIGLQTRFFEVQMEVTLDSAYFAMNSLFERGDQGFVLASRSYGLPE